MEDLSFNQNEHILESRNFQTEAESSIEILNSKVLEVRQIVGATAMSNGKGINSNSSQPKGKKTQNRSRNRSRSPTKQVKLASSESSANSIDNSAALASQKRSKSQVKRATNNTTENTAKAAKKLKKLMSKSIEDNDNIKETKDNVKDETVLNEAESQENMNFDNEKVASEEKRMKMKI